MFQCNYGCNSLNLNKHVPSFYKDITYWQKITATCPQTKSEVLNQIIRNNRFLLVNKKSIYLPRWHQDGIIHISDVFDEEKNCFLSYNSLCEKFKTKLNFLQYCSIISSIPSSWRKLLKSYELPHTLPLDPVNDPLTCKALYEKHLSLEKLPPPTAERNSWNMV